MESDLSTCTMGTDLPGSVVERRPVCGYYARRICDTGRSRLRHACGLPPQIGIYGYLLGGLGYALFGSSRHLAIGPTSAISLMVGVSAAPLAMGDPVRYAQIATLSAFVAAAMCIVAWLLRLSTLINFISETVLLGFKAGAGLSIAATQIPALLGIPGGGHNFIERVFAITSQFLQVDPVVMSIGFASLALLWLGERFLPESPDRIVPRCHFDCFRVND